MHALFYTATLIAALAALFDWRTGRIPNALTHGALLLGPALHLGLTAQSDGWGRSAWTAAAGSVIAGLACGLVPFLLFLKNGIGAGDVKLVAALGGILGLNIGIEAAFYSFLVASLVGPAKLAYRGRLFRSIGTALKFALRPSRRGEDVKTLMADMNERFVLAPSVFVGTLATAWLHWRWV